MTMGSFSNVHLDLTNNENNNNYLSNKVILAIDIGTTNLKCSLYDENLQVLHTNTSKLNILSPIKGYSEIDSNYLLSLIKENLKKCVKNKPRSYIIKSFGLSTQRNSIILWNKNTGDSYCNVILWNDKRPVKIIEAWNKGIFLNIIKSASYLASLTGTNIAGHRLKTFSQFKVETSHVTPKLKSQLNKLKSTLEQSELENVLYGTIETWVMWHLSREKVHATDVTCACSSGMYDMFHKKWSPILGVLLSIPTKIFPKVYDTCHAYGHLEREILDLDYDVPITAIIGDSQASVVAESANEIGDCVITIGTGAFISVIIGDKPLSSNNGFYPLVSYKKKETTLYILHCGITSAGVAIEWAKSIGLFNDYKEFNQILNETADSKNVRFIAAFGYLDLEGINKSKVGTGFIGITSDTTKAHMLRAVIDSIVFSIKIKFELMLKDLQSNKIKLRSVRVTGGVVQSDFFCQYLANALENIIERSDKCSSSSVYGAAFLSGVGSKVWNELIELDKYRSNVKYFKPNLMNESSSFFNRNDYLEWKKALEVYSGWD